MELGAIMKIKRAASSRKIDQSGFSLIETMFAMVLLAVGMLATLASLGYAIGANQTSQEDMLARQLASEAMESIFNARNSLGSLPSTTPRRLLRESFCLTPSRRSVPGPMAFSIPPTTWLV